MMRLLSSPKLPRRHLLILLPLLLLDIIYLYLRTPPRLPSLSTFENSTDVSWFPHQSKFWHSFAQIVTVTAPKCPRPSLLLNATVSLSHLNGTDEVSNLTKAQIACLHRSHSLFVDIINLGAPHLDSNKGTKGIATIATRSGFPVLLVNLYMLKSTGSRLAVEVFLGTEDDYKPYMCDIVLPELGAKCIILSSLLGSSKYAFEIARPQLWVFAVLFSSFESVLFLAADSFLLNSPDKVFMADGLVLWPSIESSAALPQLSELIRLDGDLVSGTPAIDHRQILISKKYHAKTLFVAAYYSIYNVHYGLLIRQHINMALAASTMNAPFFKVKKNSRQLGTNSSTSAVIQFDPTPNLNCTSPCTPPVMTIHTNWLSSETLIALGSFERLWGSEEDSRKISSRDIEAYVWGSVAKVMGRKDLQFFT
ncbi:mannosyltransferase putative-domain-containing protein [Rhexocercosporidium sp. MPI-PUGE-AT-0058]|nr:mannosyltransferase putative-domain-containing protein [Rhexocercosporidium sp. MPI-PUGE-AT-0058]